MTYADTCVEDDVAASKQDIKSVIHGLIYSRYLSSPLLSWILARAFCCPNYS